MSKNTIKRGKDGPYEYIIGNPDEPQREEVRMEPNEGAEMLVVVGRRGVILTAGVAVFTGDPGSRWMLSLTPLSDEMEPFSANPA